MSDSLKNTDDTMSNLLYWWCVTTLEKEFKHSFKITSDRQKIWESDDLLNYMTGSQK